MVVLVYGCQYIDWETKRLPDELVQVALNGESLEEKELAAAELTEYGEEAKTHMREVVAASGDPSVRAMCIHGLALIYDYESIDIMLAGLEDDSDIVQGRCVLAIRKLIGRSFHFDPSMTDADKKERIERIRQEWEDIRDSGLIERFKERMKQKEQEGNS